MPRSIWSESLALFSDSVAATRPAPAGVAAACVAAELGIGLLIMATLVAGAMFHVALMAFGQATRTFLTTTRVLLFIVGTTLWLGVIPIAGIFLIGLAVTIYLILGLVAAHGAKAGSAAGAVMLPQVLLAGALAADPHTHELWMDITPLARWDWIRWIGSTRNPDTRAIRIQKTLSKLQSGKRAACCFNRSECTDPSMSHRGVLLEPSLATGKHGKRRVPGRSRS